MKVSSPCYFKGYFRGIGGGATRRISRFEGFDQLLESMFLSLKYTAHCFLSSEYVVRCVLSELPNLGTMVATSSHRNYWSGKNHHHYEDIQLTYLFIPLPVAWFHHWVDMCLSYVEFLCWSIWNIFPECRVLHEKHNGCTSIAVKEMCVIIIEKVVWIGQMIGMYFAGFPWVDAHWIGHFVESLE